MFRQAGHLQKLILFYFQPLPVIGINVLYASKPPFQERIAHGFLVLVVGSALLFRWGQYVVLPKSFIAFDGRESVRFASPVRIGDTIQCEARVKSLSEKNGALSNWKVLPRIKKKKSYPLISQKSSWPAGNERPSGFFGIGNKINIAR
ncbi:MAG: hypothetical protein KBH92_06240 [Syntrophaceae bacterium]|nr:hypothetical protein [Syntrophaceae bacterium]MBP9531068.1 hypothetical protein [Syntrophaceae bacterium]